MSANLELRLPMTKDEWVARCAARFLSRSGPAEQHSKEFAEACFESDRIGHFSDDPEGAADKEMSGWLSVRFRIKA
jgi:hypothetical protein